MASYASFSKGPLPPRATMIQSLAGVKRALQPGAFITLTAYKRDPNSEFVLGNNYIRVRLS